MKCLPAIICLLALGCCATAQTRVDTIRMHLLDPSDGYVCVAAHRGEWRSAPQNSIQSILDAADEGVDIAEIDIRRTLDGHLVLMHNPTLSRTTNGFGFVRFTRFDKLRSLRLKDAQGNLTDMQVPTLEEALLAAKGRIMLNLDKAFDYLPQVIETARRTGTLDHIILKSSGTPGEMRKKLGQYADDVIYMPIMHLDEPGETRELEFALAAFCPCVVEFNFRNGDLITPYLLKNRLKGITRIWYNDLGRHAAGYGVEHLVSEFGAGVIQTDDCIGVICKLDEMGKRQ